MMRQVYGKSRRERRRLTAGGKEYFVLYMLTPPLADGLEGIDDALHLDEVRLVGPSEGLWPLVRQADVIDAVRWRLVELEYADYHAGRAEALEDR